MSCVTIVYQDEVGGLQVKSKEGKLMDTSPYHQNTDSFLKKPVNRLSLAFSWCFEDEKVILAPRKVVGEGNVRIYEPFVCSDYLEFIESSERGKFEKVGFTVKHFALITL
ncbi:hypothetical protein NC651_031836 [Populus alba x Populus x berolinensis]|nr:hypothetical protein NC651_031836 [Populus alba x Populus x berolinensis]